MCKGVARGGAERRATATPWHVTAPLKGVWKRLKNYEMGRTRQ